MRPGAALLGLAAIGSVTFASPGWLAPGTTVTSPLLPGADPTPRFVEQCLASSMARKRAPAGLMDKTRAAMWSHAAELHLTATETSLVHGDFGGRNLIVRRVAGCWGMAAVLDWEFAVSGSQLADVGHLPRYEERGRPPTEPRFRAGLIRATVD